jgi:carboxyl-terminal processing protease
VAAILAVVVFNFSTLGAETTRQTDLPEDWTNGLALLSQGRFDEAEPIITKITSTNQPNPRIAGWMAAYEKLQTDRRGRIQEVYQQYADWANEDMASYRKGDQSGLRGWWWYASRDAAGAFQYADDEDVFREEPWMTALVKGSLKAAAEFEEADKWIKAAVIYARLGDMFPLNAEYRDALKRCQAHIRIDLTYTPDTEWETEVKDIVPEMANDAFQKIEIDHLRAVSFQEMTIKGLEQVLRLVDAAPEVFDGFEDEETIEEFVDCVNVHLGRAREKENEEATAEDIEEALGAVLRITQRTKLLPEDVLVYEFVQGALQPLDRFSDMIWPSTIDEFHKHTQGRFCGVGIQIRKAPGEPILVISPLKDSPAFEAGVRPGDFITKINGESASGYTITHAVREITGRPGTTVRLTFKRDNKEFELTLERREIIISTIKGTERIDGEEWNFMLDPELKIGYARMTNFTDETIDELESVITRLVEEEAMRGFIFDLRGNPGGPLKAAIDVAKLFLGDRKEIVSTKGRRGDPWRQLSDEEAPFNDFPMIVLINSSSASASEIVAGALQVHKRALIVGERSFGKGSVQQVFPVTNSRNAYLKLTTSLYYLPNGRCLHRDEDSTTWGVDPDVEVKLVPKEEFKVRELQLRADIRKGKGQDELTAEDVKSVTEYRPSTHPSDKADDDEEEESAAEEDDDEEEDEDMPEIDRKDENSFPEIDPQLEAAKLLMRIRLESQQPWPTQQTPEMAATNPPATDG